MKSRVNPGPSAGSSPAADFELIFERTPDAVAVVLPDAPRFTVLAVSERFAEIAGKAPAELKGAGIAGLFANKSDGESWTREAIASLRRTVATLQPDTTSVREYRTANGCRYVEPGTSPVLGEDGKARFLIYRLTDVTRFLEERGDEARKALIRSEAEYRRLADALEAEAVIGTWECDVAANRVYANSAFAALYSIDPQRAAAGVPIEEFIQAIHPQDRRRVETVVQNAIETRGVYSAEYRVVQKDGSTRWVLARGHCYPDAEGGALRFPGVVFDITERKAKESRNEFLLRLDDALRVLTDAEKITQRAAEMLGEQLNVNRCAYATVESDEDTFNLTGDYNLGVSSIVGRYRFAHFGAECLRLMRAGQPYVVDDSEIDGRTEEFRESYRKTEIRSVICVSLLKAGRLAAAMAVHQKTPRRWLPNEVEMVQAVASRCWESLERARIARELREREQRYRFLAESIPQMVWTARPDGALDYASDQVTQYFGRSANQLLGWRWLRFVHPEDRKEAVRRWHSSVTSSTAYETSFRLLRGEDETWRWHLARALPMRDKEHGVLQWFGTCTDIEDQKQAEVNLRQQWHTFDTVLSHTPDFAYIFGRDGRLTYANRAMLAMWRLPLEAARGRNYHELGYPPETATKLDSQIQLVIETKKPLKDRMQIPGAEGETRYHEYIYVPVFSPQGEVEAVAGSTRDITELKRVEELMEEERRRWRDLFLQTPAAVAVLRGPDHRLEWVNNEFGRLVGRSAEALLGHSFAAVVPEIDGRAPVEALDRVYRTGEPFPGHESRIQVDRGEGALQDCYVNYIYLATRGVTGEIDGIFAHFTEVTDMVLARRKVEENEQLFRTLAESIPNLAWMANADGHIFWYNQRWYEYTGTTLEQMEGWGWQSVHDRATLPKVMERWKESLQSGQPFDMVFPLRGADGEFRQFLTRVEPVRDTEGRITRWLGTNTDITEQRRIEEELRRINRELEEFAYVASHDLQEPLRMVNIYTHLILRRLATDDPVLKELAGFVRQGVLRMEMLIKDLLSFSRTVQMDEPDAGTADLGAALREAMSALASRIVECGAAVDVGPLPLTRGDTAQMGLVFQNLLSNALKYRKPEEPPRVRIAAERKGDEWIVSVEDNGIGFDPRYATRIFGLFKRLHKEEYPGTGLGLAICQRIVERYGGRMWAEGRPGEGATFYMALPPDPAE